MRLSLVPLLPVLASASGQHGWTGLDWSSLNTWGTYFLPVQGVVKVWANDDPSTSTTTTATATPTTTTPTTTTSAAPTTTYPYHHLTSLKPLSCPAKLLDHPINHVCTCEKRTTTAAATTATAAGTTTSVVDTTTSAQGSTTQAPT